MALQLISTIAVISVAFFGEAIFGLGGGFLSIPLLSLFLDVKSAITLVLIFQFLMGLLILKSYKHINGKIAIPMTFSVIIGTIIGTYMLSQVDDLFMRKFLALTIFAFLTKMIFFKGFNFGKNPRIIWGFATGLAGGWFQGITGTSSPVFTMYLTTATPTKETMRATLIYIFFISSIIRVVVSFSKGLFTHSIISTAIPVLPFFFLAIYLGQHMHKKIGEQYYRYAIYIILFFSGISLFLKK